MKNIAITHAVAGFILAALGTLGPVDGKVSYCRPWYQGGCLLGGEQTAAPWQVPPGAEIRHAATGWGGPKILAALAGAALLARAWSLSRVAEEAEPIEDLRRRLHYEAQIALEQQRAQLLTAELLISQAGVEVESSDANDEPEEQPQAAEEPAPSEAVDWQNLLRGYHSILIYGAQGGGKTTMAEWLIRERKAAGHYVVVLDPHREFGQWPGCQVIGDGYDWEAIKGALKGFSEEIRHRYKERASQAGVKFEPLTIVIDEWSQAALECGDAAAEFFRKSLSDIRKINIHAVFVGHGRTLEVGGGGAKGWAAVRDASLLEIELMAEANPTNRGKVRPTGTGRLKLPGIKKPVEIQIPHREEVTA